MSSADESPSPAVKKRKIQRACDYCRRKKIKCDGSSRPGNQCSKCTTRHIECTYLLGQNNSYPRSYVEDLESRLERMEKAMSKLCPDTDISKEFNDHQAEQEPASALTPASDYGRAGGSRAETPLFSLARAVAPPTPDSDDGAQSHSDSEEGQELDKDLTEGMRMLSVHAPPLRYHGKSSSLVFLKTALDLKNEFVSSQPPLASKDDFIGSGHPPKEDEQPPWLKTFMEEEFPLLDERSFPPRDLLDALVALYFRELNTYCPLLHEPTFTRAVAAGEHLRDGSFGATVLMACALGARFTRDPRVLLDGSDRHHRYSAGWKWFRVVERARRMSFAPAKIYDIQICVLMAHFLQGTHAPQSTWPIIGAGIRIALDVGAHRRKMYAPNPAVEGELWRRALWNLVLLEWMTSYGMGRPSSIHDEDLDLALPTECDDEYWLTPDGEPSFKQPPGKPSKVTAFVNVLKLGQILAFATRTIYSTNKSRAQLGQSDEQWEQRIVADLDSALNKWSDSLPSHLRWDPEQEDALWLTQAASLRAFHYYVQFAVHRPFMAVSRRDSPLSFPSVIICTNGARASIQGLEVLYKRTGSPCHRNMGMLFMSGVVLMMNVLGLKRSGRAVHSRKDMALVENAVEMLQSLRYETHIAESLGGLLDELVSAFKEPVPRDTHMAENAPSSPAANSKDATGGQLIGQTNDASSGSSSSTSVGFAQLGGIPSGLFTFSLPAGSDDLGLSPPGFAMPGDSSPSPSAQRDPLRVHDYTATFLSQQDPTQFQQQQQQGVGQTQFDMAGENLFPGLQPLGYSTPASFLPMSPSQGEPADYLSQLHSGHALPNATTAEMGDQDQLLLGPGVPDFALMGDALMAWSNLPPAMGWEEWGAYFADTNNAGT